MTTHQFVEQSSHYYSQMDSYGFAHATLEDRYLMHDCSKLHEYFNKLFDDVFAAKEREMAAIREKNERIRYIDSELKLMFGESVSRIPVDPEWHRKVKICMMTLLHDSRNNCASSFHYTSGDEQSNFSIITLDPSNI